MTKSEVKTMVKDLTVDEFKSIVRETILEVVDPDYGHELSAETERTLMESLRSRERVSVKKVAEKLELDW